LKLKNRESKEKMRKDKKREGERDLEGIQITEVAVLFGFLDFTLSLPKLSPFSRGDLACPDLA